MVGNLPLWFAIVEMKPQTCACMERSWRSSRPSPFATSMAIMGLFIAILEGWLGGELVFRLGVGVHQTEEIIARRKIHLRGSARSLHPGRRPRRRYPMNSNQ